MPNGTLRAITFLKGRMYVIAPRTLVSLSFLRANCPTVRSSCIDVNSTKDGVLVTLGTSSCVVSLQDEKRGKVEHFYSRNGLVEGFCGTFAAQGQGVLFGCTEGCALVWDTKSGALVYGLDHRIQDGEPHIAGLE